MQARISVEQPASATIPTLTGIRRVELPEPGRTGRRRASKPWLKPIELNIKVSAPRRIVVFGRGLDTGMGRQPPHHGRDRRSRSIDGTATLVRGDLDLAGRRFDFDTGTIELDGPIRLARIDISAERAADRCHGQRPHHRHAGRAQIHPRDRPPPCLRTRSSRACCLAVRPPSSSGFEAAQLAAGLAQLAGGQAGFDPVGLVRKATGLDRVVVSAPKTASPRSLRASTSPRMSICRSAQAARAA